MKDSCAGRRAPEAPGDNGDHPDDTILEEDDVTWTDDVAPIRYPDNPTLDNPDYRWT
jgi:hypothetical protein